MPSLRVYRTIYCTKLTPMQLQVRGAAEQGGAGSGSGTGVFHPPRGTRRSRAAAFGKDGVSALAKPAHTTARSPLQAQVQIDLSRCNLVMTCKHIGCSGRQHCKCNLGILKFIV